MTNSESWLVLSFAIMVIAVPATLNEKLEHLEERLQRLEAERESGEEGLAARGGSIEAEHLRHRADRARGGRAC